MIFSFWNIFFSYSSSPPIELIYWVEFKALFIARDTISYDSIFPARTVVVKNVNRNFGENLRKELAKNVANKVKKGGADMRTGLF